MRKTDILFPLHRERVDTQRERIKKIVKREGMTCIKDLTTSLGDLSRKTVQGRVKKMIEDGELMRQGKAWDRDGQMSPMFSLGVDNEKNK